MTSRPRALVVRAAGTNCDVEVARAFTLAGADAELVHVDRLIAEPALLARVQIVSIPGGFSYGDDVASGRIFAMKLRERLYAPLRDAAERGTPIVGICNGFQILVQVGLLPGPGPGEAWADEPPAQTVSVIDNAGARYISQCVPLAVEPGTVCLWTDGLERYDEDQLRMPIGHGEGRFVAPPAVVEALEAGGQVALRYRENVNGSVGAIAGICDATGRIMGLMPHPDRFLSWHNHPYHTRLRAAQRSGDTPGLAVFKAAVAAVRGVSAA